jgi:hypothetical protein
MLDGVWVTTTAPPADSQFPAELSGEGLHFWFFQAVKPVPNQIYK